MVCIEGEYHSTFWGAVCKETLQVAWLGIDDDDGVDTMVDWQGNVTSSGM